MRGRRHSRRSSISLIREEEREFRETRRADEGARALGAVKDRISRQKWHGLPKNIDSVERRKPSGRRIA